MSLSHWKYHLNEKIVPLGISFFLVLLFALFSFLQPKGFENWMELLENLSYDFQVRSHHKPLGKESSIAIIDIDDKSLETQGRWPWSRKKLSELISKTYQSGATIVALDITFPDVEQNVVSELESEIKKVPNKNDEAVLSELNKLEAEFDYDELFGKSLALGDSLLGFVFSDQGDNLGILPPPISVLSPQLQKDLSIPEKTHFLGNIPVLQKAAKNGGFINSAKDPDGVLRFTNLLLRRGGDLYTSLSLQAASQYLLVKKIELKTERYGNSTVLEGIKLDQQVIPTNPMGQILIPYRGPSFTFPYLSATDVLEGKVDRSAIEGKLIFIGFSASALADLYSTSVDPVFPGVEVHASVASGILDNYLPYKPYWGRGAVLFLMLLVGVICAALFPFLDALMSTILCLAFAGSIFFLDNWLWNNKGIVIETLYPIGMIATLFIFNLAWGYFKESKKGKELKSVFGQYVPPAYLEEMLRKGGEINLEGESKELSVLFSDIRSFTSISEKLTAHELKQFLNRFFNPITEVIFRNKGTIDKYVGDMVMAFWGAPLETPYHASQAVHTAIEMQKALSELNTSFVNEGKQPVKIGIGVNTGLMNVGDMGSKFRRAYTVLGDPVNLASRLEGQSKYYSVDILVGENTWAQTKDEIAYRKIDKIKVKGKETGIEIYEPICLKANMSEDLKKELEKHNLALDAYFKQDWAKSSQLFEELKTSYPHRAGLYGFFVERIAKMKLEPYKEGWDGSYVSTEK